MDWQRYVDKKKSGRVAMAKVGDAYAVSEKRYDTETGERVQDVIEAVDRTSLIAEKAVLAKRITAIDIILADMDSIMNTGEPA